MKIIPDPTEKPTLRAPEVAELLDCSISTSTRRLETDVALWLRFASAGPFAGPLCQYCAAWDSHLRSSPPKW